MNAVVTTTPADQFRAKASVLLNEVSELTLHELVDEFQRLTSIMDKNLTEDEDGDLGLNETGELAKRERQLVIVAAQARFGISFDAHDRPSSNSYWNL